MKWEYIYYFTDKNVPYQLEQAGEEGWELIAITQEGKVKGFYFKRKKNLRS